MISVFDTDSSPGKELVIRRVFDAPRELVFQAFTEAERLAQWWGPKGFTIRVSRLDFQQGGIFHYRMVAPDGHDMWGRFLYREIAAPERIVWVNSFSDEDANVTRPPFSDPWPPEILNTVTLDEQDGKTVLTLRARPINASEVERATFEAGFDSMQQGYGGTWDQLADYLAAAQAGT